MKVKELIDKLKRYEGSDQEVVFEIKVDKKSVFKTVRGVSAFTAKEYQSAGEQKTFDPVPLAMAGQGSRIVLSLNGGPSSSKLDK